ncbi:MAG: MFS transporter, partial [Kurthia sp.]|nr:MFS transporter [Kurthia sp.]
VQHTTYSVIFMMCMIIGIISFLLAVFTKVPGAESTTVVQPTEKSKGSFISQYIELKAMPIAIVTFLMCFGYAAILSFISLFAKERNLEVASSYFFIVYAIAVLLTRPVTGKMLDRFGGNSVMYPCFIFFGTGLILMSFAHSAFILLLAGILIGIGYGNLSSGAQALAIKLTPPHRMGLATSTYFIALDAGLGVGPYLLGYVIPVFGYSVLYTSLGIFIFALILLYYVVYGKRERMLKVSQLS